MTDQPKPPGGTVAGASSPTLTEAGLKARAEREARSAAALRENLRRRKAQARARTGTATGAATGAADSPTRRDPEGG